MLGSSSLVVTRRSAIRIVSYFSFRSPQSLALVVRVTRFIKMADSVVYQYQRRLVLINASIIIKKKKEQADQDRKYDSLRIYLGNTSDEWERQRTLIREISFAVCRAGKGRHAVHPPVCCGLFDLYQVHDAPIIIMDYYM